MRFLISFLVFLSSSFSFASSYFCPQGNYAFYCRGRAIQMLVDTYGILIDVYSNNKPAWNAGIGLNQGRCAWEDRAVLPGEAKVIRFAPKPEGMHLINSVVTCLNDPRCVVQFCAHAEPLTPGVLQTFENWIQIWHAETMP